MSMENESKRNMRTEGKGIIRSKTLLENLLVVILAFYPLRHISWGLDLWDTGYNYANFTYMGMDHMDSMWLFATYLSNLVGHLITKLPNAGTLLGMNLYTGLFVSFLALLGFRFCTRTLKMPVWIAFLGEMAAISLCWCPTALLYNYMNYSLLLGAVILLYHGLTKEKKACLITAGICLGANVLVRFSNLPQAAMILAVWAYDLIVWREEKKSFWKRALRHTGWCLAGYVAALGALLGYIGLRYGLGEYVEGIGRLFAMTDKAVDYKAVSMLSGVIGTYLENMYWVIRIAVIVAAGTAVASAAAIAANRLKASPAAEGKNVSRRRKIAKWIEWAAVGLSVFVGAAMLLWMYYRKFCSFSFTSYDSMLRPGILFLMLTMLIALIRIFHPRCAREEKLISGMLILVILLTSLGSNNGVYPSINNLFVAAPYTLWESWRFCRDTKNIKIAHAIISPLSAKAALIAFLLMCAVQFGGFGIWFTFAEATGVQDVSAGVENNEILRGIRMSPDKAEAMTELTDYIVGSSLQGEELIPYGGVPSLSYYLQMPAAFNPWSVLASYSVETMAAELDKLENETPVIILDNLYAVYEEKGEKGLTEGLVTEEKRSEMLSDEKWELLQAFMEKKGYEQTFRNEKFAVYR